MNVIIQFHHILQFTTLHAFIDMIQRLWPIFSPIILKITWKLWDSLKCVPLIILLWRKRLVTIAPGWSEFAVTSTPSFCSRNSHWYYGFILARLASYRQGDKYAYLYVCLQNRCKAGILNVAVGTAQKDPIISRTFFCVWEEYKLWQVIQQ